MFRNPRKLVVLLEEVAVAEAPQEVEELHAAEGALAEVAVVVDSVVDSVVVSALGVAQEVDGEVSEDAAKTFETDFLWRSGAIGMMGLTFCLDVGKDVLLTSSLHFFVNYIYYPFNRFT